MSIIYFDWFVCKLFKNKFYHELCVGQKQLITPHLLLFIKQKTKPPERGYPINYKIPNIPASMNIMACFLFIHWSYSNAHIILKLTVNISNVHAHLYIYILKPFI